MTSTTVTAESAESITYEQFLEAVDEDTRAEWVNGRIVMSSPVSQEHQSLGLFLITAISEFVTMRQLGRVFYESFQMKTAPDLPGREPDLLFVANENLSRVRQNFLDGPADLAVEIISPESFARDRGEKFREYEQVGVREYWLLDPLRRRAEFYLLGADGFYVPVLPDADGIYHSAVLSGLTLRVTWFWQDPPPRLLDVLREWGLV
jgi:Uma2 family endonuclease